MRKILGLLLMVFLNYFGFSQMPGGGGGRSGFGGPGANIGHFYGKIVDGKTNKGIDAVSVQLFQSKFDTTTKKRKDTIVSGMLTRANGEFSLENLPLFGSYHLKISAIGYKAIDQKVAFEMKMPKAGAAQAGQGGGDMSQALAGIDKDLGNIKMETDQQVLENVTVTGTKPMFQMGVDRKVFNVEKSLISTGQTAQELMKNIPSVNVDIDGNVTLRNAAPTIFVDGRPTTLTLDQIPADAIESVEIITNPSAKFDASGGTAGILNIVLKKNRKTGYNGNLRAGIDSRGKFNAGGDINAKQGKVNIFASGNYNQRKSISDGTVFSENISDPITDVNQATHTVSNGNFAFGRAGFDYFMNNRNTITVSGMAVHGKFENTDDLNFDSLANATEYTKGTQLTNSNMEFKNFGAALGYKHNFAKAGKELTSDLNFNSSNSSSNGLYNIQLFQPDNTPKGGEYLRQTIGNGINKFFTGQLDFTNPISDKIKIEMGARAAIRHNENISNNYVFDPASSTYVYNESLSSNYKFDDRVFAGYVTFSQKLKTWSYQAGLRAESSDYTGTKLLTGKDSTFKTNYPISLFPSFFITKDLGKKQDFQINYSRRINRPNFFQLIPFKDITNPQYPTVGNPGLKPEFTNSFEMSYQKTFQKNNSLLMSVYFKQTTDLITRYQFKDRVSDNATDSATFTSYQNANSAMAYGLEITSHNPLTKWWDMTTNVNFYNASINASNVTNAGGTTQRLSYFAKWNNSFKLPKNFSIQLSGDYQSKSVLPQSSGNGGGGGRGMFGGGPQPSAQGYINPNYGFDLAIKKEFLKNKAASLTLSVNDILKTRKYSYYSYSSIVIQDYSRVRDQQIFRLNFNYRFGKMDVSLFKRKNMRSGMDGMQDAQQ
jgi:outer membrane receptor protein involved in Fe transport